MSGARRVRFPKPARPEAKRGIGHDPHVRFSKSPSAKLVWEIEQVVGRGEGEIRRLASAQRGLILREQLLAAGLGRGAIQHRLDRRRLVLVHPGVYRVGHDALAPLAAEMAALLYYRGHALLSHRSAAAVLELVPKAASEIELTIAGQDARSRAGVKLHRVATLDRRDVRFHVGLPLTAPARTVIELAGLLDDSTFEQALAQARIRWRVTDRDLAVAMDRCPGRKGIARLRAQLRAEAGPALTRSEAERGLIRLIDGARLPRPVANVRVEGYEVDFLWPGARLIVEVDGHRFHGHRTAFERDRRRDQRLVAAGYRVIRVTWRQLIEEPLAVIATIARSLTAGGDG